MRARFWLLVLLASLSGSFSLSASAATYRCSSANGQVYYADRPCSGGSPQANGDTRLGSVGPAPEAPPPMRTYTPSVPKPPEHSKYLTGNCAQMEEAIRTAPARGVQGETLRGLYEEYRNKCEYEVRQAQERVYADKREQDRLRVEQRQMVASQQAEDRRQENQCNNMRAVIADKRANMASLDARQRELLQTMQENYNRSCLNRQH